MKQSDMTGTNSKRIDDLQKRGKLVLFTDVMVVYQ